MHSALMLQKLSKVRKEKAMGENCTDCTTCRYRYLHFPNMDDFEISMQECLCDGEDYEEE